MGKTAAVILAGGGGTRLGGVIKANLEISGATLISMAETALADQAAPIVIACGHFSPGQIKGDAAHIQIKDADGPSAGPVSGLAAVADWCEAHAPEAQFLLSMAVDTPFFPTDFVDRAEPLMTSGIDVVFGISNGQAYPTNALWRLSALGDLSARIEAGNAATGLKAVMQKSATAVIEYPDNVFFNVNTREELALAAQHHL